MADMPERGRKPVSAINPEWVERRAKRRQEGATEDEGLKLPIPDWVREKYPPTEFEYYWFTGTPARLHQAQKKDWYPVDGGEGARLPGASDKEGLPVEHILCVKPKEWYVADRSPREALRLEQEEQMLRGNLAGKGDDAGAGGLSSDISYASASNRVS